MLLSKFLKFNLLRPKCALFLASLFCIVSVFLGSNISINLAIEGLLPETRESVRDMHAVAKEVGGSGNIIMLIGPTAHPTQYVAPILQKMQSYPEIKYAYAEQEKYLLKDNLFYLLSDQDFSLLFKQVKKLLIKKSDFFNLGLDDEDDSEEDEKERELKESVRSKVNQAESSRYFESSDNQYVMIMARPAFDSMDLKKSEALIAKTQDDLSTILNNQAPFTLLGRYQEHFNDTLQFKKDIAKTGLISLIGISLVLIAGLGSLRAGLLVVLATTLSMAMTVGLAKMLVGQINILTGFLLAILSGLGTEYGIHLIRRYYQVKGHQQEIQKALHETVFDMGPTLFSAALTSAAAFFILVVSDFKGFSELGIIAGAGIISIYFVYMMCFPSFPQFLRPQVRFSRLGKFFDFYPVDRRWALPLLLLVPLVIYGVTRAEFEFEFDKMHGFSKETQKKINLSRKLFGRSLTPTGLLARDQQTAREIELWLRQKEHVEVIDQVYSKSSLVPEKAQVRFKKMLQMKATTDRYSDQEILKYTGVEASKIRRWLATAPYELKELPAQIREAFGPDENVVLVYPRQDLTVYSGLQRFTSLMKKVKQKFPGTQVGSEAMVFNEIIDHIIDDGRIVLVLFALGSLLIFLGIFKNFGDALFLELQLILGGGLLVGLMGLIGVKFTILNVAMIPAVLATGIDMGVHVLHGQKHGQTPLASAQYVAAGVNLSALTTIMGFGSLFFAQAQMLKGIAWISVLGQSSMYFICMIFIPVLRELLLKRNPPPSHPKF